MNDKRLLRLAKFLRRVPKRRFNMMIWASGLFCGRPKEVEHKCGTSACALGWASSIPSFKRDGLILKNDFDSDEAYVFFDGVDGYCAASRFFEIGYESAKYLFDSEYGWVNRNKETPKQVAERIERFVKTMGSVPA